MLGVCRASDINSGQDSEDVRLQEDHEHFEGGEEHQHEERQDAADGKNRNVGFGLEHCLAEQCKRDQQDVTSEHVREESHSERQWANDDRGEEFDEAHEWLQCHWHAWGPEQVGQVAQLLVLEAGADEDHPDQQRQEQWDGDTRRGGHLQDRHDAGEVAQEDEHEQAEQERGPSKPLFAHGLHDDAVFDELNRRLGQVANAGRRHCGVLAAGKQKHEAANYRCGNGDERDLVERRKEVVPAQDFVDWWKFKTEHF